jgi:NAD(P)-dependent dehydrogenase (short-subunit alcohol dehydrogenase family)
VRLQGKAAIISGGGTGIGAATARRFAAEGAGVVVLGRRPEPVEAVARQIGGVAVAGDAADPEHAGRAVRTAVERFGGVDVVVAGAGGRGTPAVLETGDEVWADSFRSNVTTAFVLTREALPSLIDRRGAIVIVASLAGHAAGPENAGYTAAKHGLIGLARSLARDYGPRGVRTNVVSPGWVRTPMADEEMDELASRRGVTREEAYVLATADVPLRRPATAEEIASVCLFLASDESSIVNGAVIRADGGAHVVDVPTLAFQPDRPPPG